MNKLATTVVTALFALTLTAQAGLIVPGVNTQWNNMVTPNRDKTPFWDNKSGDGDRLVGQTQGGGNIGYYLTGNFGITGESNAGPATIFTPGGLSTALNQPASSWEYLSTVSNVYVNPPLPAPGAFSLAGGFHYDFTFLGGVSAATTNVMGWYALSDPNTLHPLFTGKNATGTVGLDTNVAIGIYFTSSVVNGTFRSTDTNLNMGSFISPGIATFEKKAGSPGNDPVWGNTLLGFEDLWRQYDNYSHSYYGDNDYNDMMVGVKATSLTIPEPETWVMFSVSFAVVGVMVVRRQRRRARLNLAGTKGYFAGLPN